MSRQRENNKLTCYRSGSQVNHPTQSRHCHDATPRTNEYRRPSINGITQSQLAKVYNESTPLLNTSELSVNNKNVDASNSIQAGVSWSVAAFLLVNTALGAGMLNYPYAYTQIGGIWSAAMIQSVLLIFIISTMFILVYCADFNRDDTYHGVLLSMCGKRAQQVSALSILLTCYGINITFLVIIGDQYDRIFTSLLPSDMVEYWFVDRKFTIFATSVLFIWPMCYAKRLDFLRYASILGMFAMLYVAFLTVYEYYKLDELTIMKILATHNHDQSSSKLNNTNSTNHPQEVASFSQNQQQHSLKWFEPLAIVPVLCFAYQTHEVIVPVYACMKERAIGSFMKATSFGLVILFLLYNIVGAHGYLTFGEFVGPDIMSLYDAKDPVVVIGIVALVVKFITTYPPLMFCGRSALDGLYGELRQLTTLEFKTGERTRRMIITTFWFVTTVLLAIFAPDISVTLQLLGSMASINVFVFPGMCLVSLIRRLRRARMSVLMGELPEGQSLQQQAKDYYLISGSTYLRQNSLLKDDDHNNKATCSTSRSNALCANAAGSNRQRFTATFASLMEFENNVAASCRLDTTGKLAEDKFEDEELSRFLDKIEHGTNKSSMNVGMLDRLSMSMAPSTVAQAGISRCTACCLYFFASILIAFGVFIFMLEIMNVFGFL